MFVTVTLNRIAKTRTTFVTVTLNRIANTRTTFVTVILNRIAKTRTTFVTVTLNRIAKTRTTFVTVTLNRIAKTCTTFVTVTLNRIAKTCTTFVTVTLNRIAKTRTTFVTVQIVGDYFILAPTYKAASVMTALNLTVFVYNYEYRSSFDQWEGQPSRCYFLPASISFLLLPQPFSSSSPTLFLFIFNSFHVCVSGGGGFVV